jgi:hypothetical protein
MFSLKNLLPWRDSNLGINPTTSGFTTKSRSRKARTFFYNKIIYFLNALGYSQCCRLQHRWVVSRDRRNGSRSSMYPSVDWREELRYSSFKTFTVQIIALHSRRFLLSEYVEIKASVCTKKSKGLCPTLVCPRSVCRFAWKKISSAHWKKIPETDLWTKLPCNFLINTLY